MPTSSAPDGNHWQNRIVAQRDASIAELSANPLNWRLHPAHQHQALDGALDVLGWLRPIIVNHKTNVIVDGHLRVLRARERGDTAIPAYFVDITEAEEAVLLYAFDLSAGLAQRDPTKLDRLARRLPGGTRATTTGDPTLDTLVQSLRRGEAALLGDGVDFRGSSDQGHAGLVRFRVGLYTWDEEETVYAAWLAQMREQVGDDSHAITQHLLGRLQLGHA